MPDQQAQPREEFPSFQPTPTQIENDLAAIGHTTIHKVPDGSNEQPPPENLALKALLLAALISPSLPEPPPTGLDPKSRT